MANDMEEKRKHGGRRAGSGRPSNDRNIAISVRVSQEAFDKLNRLTKNKSEFIDNILKQFDI